ncbi:MAG TPA: imidazole glycerol phosphate synthase subunit HisH [Candidatus Limnocylindrales bacterium]|nr:imidazole glycerol phosphate synthase subunit HisH [Candidatus Limnocylindrales bacterium]
MSGADPSGPRIAVVDYDAGNLVSIAQAFTSVGAVVTRATTPHDLDGADALVVPGVGAAGPAMERLRVAGLVEPILRWIEADRPFLGICLGLQLLFEGSDEDGAETFGVLRGRTRRLEGAPTIPHIGWNQVERRRPHPAFDGLGDAPDMYFVHSYAGAFDGDGSPEEQILAETTHGGTFVSAIARGRLLGVQFHPERSGDNGLRLLASFVGLLVAEQTAVPA